MSYIKTEMLANMSDSELELLLDGIAYFNENKYVYIKNNINIDIDMLELFKSICNHKGTLDSKTIERINYITRNNTFDIIGKI